MAIVRNFSPNNDEIYLAAVFGGEV